MGLFDRKKQHDEPLPAVLSDVPRLSGPAPSAGSSLVTVAQDGNIQVRATNPAEAKAAIKELKAIKKEYGLTKKSINAEIAQLRADRRLRLGTRGSTMRGGGSVGKFVRGIDRMNRDAERAQFARSLAPLDGKKAVIERYILSIESMIAQLEAYIARESATTEALDPAERLASQGATITCPMCGASNLPLSIRFCPNCGMKRTVEPTS